MDKQKRATRFRQLVEIYVREIRMILKDQGLVLFFLFLPLAYPVIYSLIYNPELVRDVPLVVVDNDRTPLSREFVRRMDATQGVRLLGYAAEMGEARHALRSKECFAILEIPEGFDRKTGRLEQADVVLYCDATLLLRYKAFLQSAIDVSQAMGAELQQQAVSELSPVDIEMSDPIPIHNIAMGNITSGFDSFVMPGVIVLILHQCIILAIGMAGGAKREPRRLIGYSSFNESASCLMTLFGQMLAYVTILVIPMLFLIHYVPLIFRFPMAGDPIQIFAFLLPMVLACISLGYCFQCIVLQRETVFVLWVITSVVFLFLSGLTWPRYAMPEVWQLVGDVIPGTWGVEGFIKMNTNGATLAQVSDCYIALWIQAAVYGILAYFMQRYIMRPAVRLRRRAGYYTAP